MYTAIAPLDITPPPESVTRILLLYKGLQQADLDEQTWLHAQRRARGDVGFWREIVGIQEEFEADLDKSRVVEWAAMEIR
jgi:hypothetical protein